MKTCVRVPLFVLAVGSLIASCTSEPPLPIGKRIHDEPTVSLNESDKGQESPLPVQDQKGDSWRSPTLHESIAFGETARVTISEPKLFHAWDFTVEEALAVQLEATPLTPNLDTVLYLYRWDDRQGSWGSYLYRNDDHEGQLRSVIAQTLEPGKYRALIKGYKETLFGEVEYGQRCAGQQCPADPALPTASGNFLTLQEAMAVLEAFDNICGDTFCCGDLNYFMQDISCDGASGVCTIKYAAVPYSGYAWTAEMFENNPDAAKVYTGDVEGNPFSVSIADVVPSEYDEDEGMAAEISCTLDGGYRSIDDLLESGNYGDELVEKFYLHFVFGCVDAMEGFLYSL